MKKEIELKVFVTPSATAAELESKLSRYQLVKESREADTYYTSKTKDFIATEECLRIRVRDDFGEMTWKPPTTSEMLAAKQYWKEEINLNVSGQVEATKKMLQRLDFIEYVTVSKHRREYRIDDETKIMLDAIEGAGLFLEIETMSEDQERGLNKNLAVLQALQIGDALRVFRPYRDIVKDGKLQA